MRDFLSFLKFHVDVFANSVRPLIPVVSGTTASIEDVDKESCLLFQNSTIRLRCSRSFEDFKISVGTAAQWVLSVHRE